MPSLSSHHSYTTVPFAVPVETLNHLPLKTVNGKQSSATADDIVIEDVEKTNLVLRTFGSFIVDLCEQFKGGHPGSAMGMAAIGVALWKYIMKYSTENPSFNRDRFVLSNGHTSIFQYMFLHLTGYKDMAVDQLKTYHSTRTDSLCPGHPEIEHEGIEVTTGPLGQGISNAVGLAMATKHLGAVYNKPGFSLVDNMTWCMISDAYLQEGVALESIQLAGHWKLNDLTVIYDNNQVTCDGSADIANSAEDVNAKMRACGWNVIDILDGNHDVEAIVNALVAARSSKDKPTFVNVRTIIGIGSQVAGDAKAHGAALGPAVVAHVKKQNGMNPEEHFVISDEVYAFFRETKSRGRQLEKDWMSSCQRSPTTPTATRKSAGLVYNPLAAKLPNLMVETADLSPSVNMAWKGNVDFQNPDFRSAYGLNGDYTGRYIHWGICEHAMASISNGLAAFGKGTILPITSIFFMFYIYAAPGLRMGALQHLQTIHIATHHSIGTGEDGPTHQPIALASLYRAMPNLLYIRPCDSEETAGAMYPSHSSRDGVQRGAYVFVEEPNADVTLIGVGAEMVFAMQTRELLASKYNIRARVVSFPCQRLFEAQPVEYKREVLQYRSNAPRVVIEAYAVNGWERYADAGISMSSFGKSLPGAAAYKHFRFDEESIAPKVVELVEEVRREGVGCLRGEFRDLNGGMK
ncbi:transketolase [Mytilinidion resinicola]|uniref:Transketolase n=1 Tax=Mytilinidion resinicola TaxID=574789 RepID=A0A6A6YEZ7_9PEZI|nr:transketolase [Mytilinidion resinicola]KAF2807372.1 transketolase [Mytilinidion resinicola]